MNNKNNNPFKKLSDHREEMDINSEWQKTLAHLEADKRKRRGFFFLPLLFLGLLLLSVSIFYSTIAFEEVNENNITNQGNNIFSDSKSENVEKIRKDLIIITDDSLNKKSVFTNHSNSKNTSQRPNSSISRNTELNSSTIKNLKQGLSKSWEEQIEKEIEGYDNFSQKNNVKVTTSENILDEINLSPNIGSNATETGQIMIKRLLDSISQLSSNPYFIDWEDKKENISPSSIKMPKSHKFSIGIISGFGNSNVNFSNKTADPSEQIKLREKYEKQLESLSAELSLTYSIRKNLYISGGLGYMRINEKLDYFSNLKSRSLSLDGISEIYTNINGEIKTVEGGLIKETYTTSRQVRYNNYQSFSIPLRMGYDFRTGRWSPFLEAGIMLQMLSNYNGGIIKSNSYVEDLDEIGGLNSNAIWLDLQSGIKYSLNYTYDISLRIKHSASLNSVFSSQDYEQRYNVFQIAIGFRSKI